MTNVLAFPGRPRITSASKPHKAITRAQGPDIVVGSKVTLDGKTGTVFGFHLHQRDIVQVSIMGDLYCVPRDRLDPAMPEQFA